MVRKTTLLFAATLMLAGCSWYIADFDKYGKNYDPIPLHRISIDDTKAQVESTLGPPINVIGSKKYDDGVIEVWAYEKWGHRLAEDVVEESYWMYFLNGKVVQWGRPGDWQREADQIYEVRVR